ncbi:MAG TPA: hypothetical protein VF552_06585 [Allosphingosinicella sp.]
MIGLFVLLIGAIAVIASGFLVRTPNPSAVPQETSTYDTDTPSQRDPRVP